MNNPNALAAREVAYVAAGMPIKSRFVLPHEEAAAFFGLTPRAVDNDLHKSTDEPRQNGYELIRGKRLQQLKLSRQATFGHEAHFVTKTTIPRMLDLLALRSRRKIAAQLALAKEHP